MLTNVKATWEEQYNNVVNYSEEYERPTPAKRIKRDRSPDAIEWHLQALYNDSLQSGNDEFDAYINGAKLKVDNVIKWWAEQPDDGFCGGIRQQALDVLSIPAMSTACERLFSSASHLVGFTRYSLADGTMESLELLRQWLQEEYIVLRGDQ